MPLSDFSYIYPSSKYPFAYFTLTRRFPKILQDIIRSNVFNWPDVNNQLEVLSLGVTTHRVKEINLSVDEKPWWLEFNKVYSGKLLTEVPFFFVEIYFYRLILDLTGYLSNGIDPFFTIKQEEIKDNSSRFVEFLMAQKKERWLADNYILFSLLGNKADLSQFVKYSITDDTHFLRNDISSLLPLFGKERRVHILLDNAATELFYDLVLAEFLVSASLCNSIHLYPKSMPLFVSDATGEDIILLLKHLSATGGGKFTGKIEKAIADKKIIIEEDIFWNTPHHFTSFPESFLQKAGKDDLVISKGDANYRRFFEDRDIPPDTPIARLGLDLKSIFFALRTLKSEMLAGVDTELTNKLNLTDPEWMVNGKYSIIQKLN